MSSRRRPPSSLTYTLVAPSGLAAAALPPPLTSKTTLHFEQLPEDVLTRIQRQASSSMLPQVSRTQYEQTAAFRVQTRDIVDALWQECCYGSKNDLVAAGNVPPWKLEFEHQNGMRKELSTYLQRRLETIATDLSYQDSGTQSFAFRLNRHGIPSSPEFITIHNPRFAWYTLADRLADTILQSFEELDMLHMEPLQTPDGPLTLSGGHWSLDISTSAAAYVTQPMYNEYLLKATMSISVTLTLFHVSVAQAKVLLGKNDNGGQTNNVSIHQRQLWEIIKMEQQPHMRLTNNGMFRVEMAGSMFETETGVIHVVPKWDIAFLRLATSTDRGTEGRQHAQDMFEKNMTKTFGSAPFVTESKPGTRVGLVITLRDLIQWIEQVTADIEQGYHVTPFAEGRFKGRIIPPGRRELRPVV